MTKINFSRIPKHIGVIPDGNRRWAKDHGLSKEKGYNNGLNPGLELYRECLKLGVEELTYYGFTQDNTKRPKHQRIAFQKACTDAVKMLVNEDAALRIIGNTDSKMFPDELIKYTKRVNIGKGSIKVNFLVNYGYEWDLSFGLRKSKDAKSIYSLIASSDISRIDLLIRWGGRRRLSGFLPLQTIYSDFYIIDDYWPDFKVEHLHEALSWYQNQDITLGG